MSQAKHHIELLEKLSGHEFPALNGAHIIIYKNKEELYIASVPLPNLTAETAHDSTTSESEDFEDEEGNKYKIEMHSSYADVYWEFEINPKNKDDFDEIVKVLEIHYVELY